MLRVTTVAFLFEKEGEDTFLSTCLAERKVMRIQCYTFHDGFSTYNHLLEGVLPISLKYIKADDEQIIERFYRACIGWVRYKPLLVYITKPESYEEVIQQSDFMNIITELEKYHKSVKKHYADFVCSQKAWAKIMDYFANVL